MLLARVLMLSAVVFSPVAALAEDTKPTSAAANIINHENIVIGKALFRQLEGGVEVSVIVHSISEGEHGIHLHEHGTCKDTESFKASGGHILHDSKPHGLDHEKGPDAGDLINLEARKDGTAFYRYMNDRVSINGENGLPALLDEDRSALIIHANPDDQVSQPIGGAGERIACGEIFQLSH